MIYAMYQFQSDLLDMQRMMAEKFERYASLALGYETPELFRPLAAGCQFFTQLKISHKQPPFNIGSVMVHGQMVSIVEEPILSTPFATLLHFRKDIDALAAQSMPKVLVISPLSGHFATLLRDTVQVLLKDHDVYITNWHNARDVSVTAGRFGVEDHVDHLIKFIEAVGPDTHVLAVCQPCVQALAAVAVMAENGHPAQPRSMTLMAGPVDVRSNPTVVNKLATRHSIEWFEDNLISRVPWMHKGAGRRVYPGFMQLSAFMSMNTEKHVNAFHSLYRHMLLSEADSARTIQTFYDEYLAVLDLPAEFYLETIDIVFQRALLAKGEMTHRGQPVNPAKIRRTALLTVEGERDDICGFGQTAAAHDLCSTLPPYMKHHHMQPDVGHYGVFSGRRWANQVYPVVRNFIVAAS